MQRTRCAAGVIAAIVLATPWIAEARPKTDRAVFLNGDVLTGEIKSLDRGKLRYSTNAMGTVSIEWDDLESIESTYCYRMRLRNGTRYFGSVAASDREGQERIVTRPEPVNIPWFDLVAIAPLEDTFLDQLDTYLNTGYSYTKASDVSEFNLGAELMFTTDYTINRLEARSIITDNGGETTNSSQINLSRQRWLKRPQHFNVSFGGFETNDELAIDYRVAVGGGRGSCSWIPEAHRCPPTWDSRGCTKRTAMAKARKASRR